MANPERIYVDTNIFIRVFEGNDDVSSAPVRLFLRDPRGRRPYLATSELTFAELLVTPIRESDEQLIQHYDNWTRSSDYLEVGPIDRAVLWSAAFLRARYTALKLPDAIHVGTALLMGCSHFLTGDLRISGSYELSDRFRDLAFGPTSIEVMRPEAEPVLAAAEAR